MALKRWYSIKKFLIPKGHLLASKTMGKSNSHLIHIFRKKLFAQTFFSRRVLFSKSPEFLFSLWIKIIQSTYLQTEIPHSWKAKQPPSPVASQNLEMQGSSMKIRYMEKKESTKIINDLLLIYNEEFPLPVQGLL